DLRARRGLPERDRQLRRRLPGARRVGGPRLARRRDRAAARGDLRVRGDGQGGHARLSRAAGIVARPVDFVTCATEAGRDGLRVLVYREVGGRIDGQGGLFMTSNRAIAYQGPGTVGVTDIEYPTFELQDGPGVHPDNVGRKLPHAAILKVVATNICGSDQHMVRGRTTAPDGLVLGHEITAEVVENGPGVEFIKEGDLVSVPFN